MQPAHFRRGIETISRNRRIISDPLTKALEVLKTEDDYNDAQAYAISSHLLDSPGEYTGPWSRSRRRQLLIGFSDPDRLFAIRDVPQKADWFNNALIEFLQDAGVISPTTCSGCWRPRENVRPHEPNRGRRSLANLELGRGWRFLIQ